MQAADRQVNRCSPSAGERTAADRIAGTTSRTRRRSPQHAPAQVRETASRAGRSGRSRGGRRRHPGRGALRGRRGRTSPAAPRPKTAPQPLKTAARPPPDPARLCGCNPPTHENPRPGVSGAGIVRRGRAVRPRGYFTSSNSTSSGCCLAPSCAAPPPCWPAPAPWAPAAPCAACCWA